MSKKSFTPPSCDMPQFVGPFRDLLPGYIQYKRAQGYKISRPITCRLREMDLFFLEMGIREIHITREMYEAFTAHKPGQKETTTQKRQSAIRGFARYLVSLGYQDIYTGYDDARIFKRDFIPYVFSAEETDRMFRVLQASCGKLPCHENDTFRLAMLMYYCCGFRRSELTNLLVQDFDFQDGTITVLHGKNDVSRRIPVSDSPAGRNPCLQGKISFPNRAGRLLFLSEKEKGTVEGILYRKFHQLLEDAGIPPRADGDASACMMSGTPSA